MNGYKLTFTSPLHIGLHADDEDMGRVDSIVHSDTLFSALVSAGARVLGLDAGELCRKPPFIISSAFPYASYEKVCVYFLPRPYIRLAQITKEDKEETRTKKTKKVRWVSAAVFQEWIQGAVVDLAACTLSSCGTMAAAQGELPEGFERGDTLASTTRCAVDRAGGETKPYPFASLWFKEDCGLYVLAAPAGDAKDTALLETMLRALGDEGLGADRSSGYGRFTVEPFDLSLNIPSTADGFVNLSLLYPRKDELETLLPGAAYSLIVRGGHVTAPGIATLRRRSVRMFTEGASFTSGTEPYGAVPVVLDKDQTGAHPIYRYGIGFPVPAVLGKETGS